MQGFNFEIALQILLKEFEGKQNKKPVIFHSVRVGTFLWNNSYDEDLQIAGLLHDILEDTDCEEEVILDNFGKEVLDIVKANSKNNSLEKSEILEDIVKRCSEMGERAMIVKIADIYDNFLFYKKEKNIPEIERCKRLARFVKKYKKDDWNDKIFEKVREILEFENKEILEKNRKKQKFENWNILKQKLQEKESQYKFKEGEIWWTSLGQNIGQESYGKGDNFRRPVLILKKLSTKSCIVIPLSSQEKTGTWFCDIILEDMKRTALLYQTKMMDVKRFQRRVGVLPEPDFIEVKKRFKQLLNL